jgi:DNA-binding transcriptional LysR family regulator
MNLAEIDLNLLVVLDALLEERQLGRAATRLGYTQPALNAALNRLRRLVGDPLLVRDQGKLRPTPRAEDLHRQVRTVLGQIEHVLSPPEHFDPLLSRATFTLAVTDYCEFALLPKLIQTLALAAPGVRVAVRYLGEEFPLADLESGRVELVLGHFDELPPGLPHQALFTERLVCVLRKNHPQVKEKGTLSSEAFSTVSHVQVQPRGGALGLVDAALGASGLSRKVALKVPSFTVAPMVVASTDLCALLPARVAQHFASLLPLRVLEPPVPLDGYAATQVWHERSDSNPGVTYLRERITEAAQKI